LTKVLVQKEDRYYWEIKLNNKRKGGLIQGKKSLGGRKSSLVEEKSGINEECLSASPMKQGEASKRKEIGKKKTTERKEKQVRATGIGKSSGSDKKHPERM